jgi:hypothetical protein
MPIIIISIYSRDCSNDSTTIVIPHLFGTKKGTQRDTHPNRGSPMGTLSCCYKYLNCQAVRWQEPIYWVYCYITINVCIPEGKIDNGALPKGEGGPEAPDGATLYNSYSAGCKKAKKLQNPLKSWQDRQQKKSKLFLMWYINAQNTLTALHCTETNPMSTSHTKTGGQVCKCIGLLYLVLK